MAQKLPPVSMLSSSFSATANVTFFGNPAEEERILVLRCEKYKVWNSKNRGSRAHLVAPCVRPEYPSYRPS